MHCSDGLLCCLIACAGSSLEQSGRIEPLSLRHPQSLHRYFEPILSSSTLPTTGQRKRLTFA